jgi:hypothetical protein
MGIAKRKAGTVVRCPSCAGQVLVPNPDDESPSAEVEAPLFERTDFDEIFRQSVRRNRSPSPGPVTEPPLAPAIPLKPPEEAGFDVERVDNPVPLGATEKPAAPLTGIWLSPTATTWLSVGVILALALAFGVGLWVGLTLRPSPSDDSSTQREGRTAPVVKLAPQSA